MEKTKYIVRVAMCVALLIGGQMALTAVNGIEIVTVVLLCLCFSYGIRTGVAIATTFSLLRCFFFGFQINVIVLYLIYYNLFALFLGGWESVFPGRSRFSEWASSWRRPWPLPSFLHCWMM